MAASTERTGRAQGTDKGALHRLLGRLSRKASTAPDDLSHGELDQPPVAKVATAPMRVPVTLSGTITMITINPRGVNRWLEAVLDDGTGEVTLIWMGRRLVRGINAGRTLQVTGTITLLDGRRVIYNPNYSLKP